MNNESKFNQNGRVIVFLKEIYSFNYGKVQTHNNMKAKIIKINITNKISGIVSAVYRFPDSDVLEFLHNLNTLLERVNNDDCDITIDILKSSDCMTSLYLNIWIYSNYKRTCKRAGQQ